MNVRDSEEVVEEKRQRIMELEYGTLFQIVGSWSSSGAEKIKLFFTLNQIVRLFCSLMGMVQKDYDVFGGGEFLFLFYK